MESVSKEFLCIEHNNHLYDFHIGDFYPWIYIRNDIYGVIKAETNVEMVVYGGKKKLKGLAVGQFLTNITLNSPLRKIRKCDYLFVCFPQRVKVDDEYECRFTDRLASLYKNTQTWEVWDKKQKHLTPAKSRYVVYLDYLDFLSNILSLLGLKKNSDDSSDCLKSFSSRIVDAFKNLADNKLDEYDVYKLLKKRYIQFVVRKPLIRRMLEIAKPEVIVEICSQHVNLMIINNVASEMCIPTIELQHGLFTKENIVYSVSEKRYIKELPDYFFTFSDVITDNCGKSYGKLNAVTMGYPFGELQKQRFAAKREGIVGNKSILVISTPLFRDDLKRTVEGLISLMSENKKQYKVVYRLHPTESVHDYQNWSVVQNGCVTICSFKEKDIYECFAESQYQIGCSSTALYEGMMMGLKTFVIDNECSRNSIKEFGQESNVHFIASPEDLYSQLSSMTKDDDYKEIFKPNALKNIKSGIDNVLMGKDVL